MHCKEVQENLSLYIDGELPGEQAKEIEAHLMECPQCKIILEQYRIIDRQAMDLTVEPPVNLMKNVMKGIAPKKRSFYWRKITGVAVASVLILFALVMWNNNVRSVSADEIVLKMANTLDNLDSYHIEVNIEETYFKSNGQDEVKKGKIVEYMKKPYYQRLESDFPYSEVSIENGEKSFHSFSNNNFSRTFRQLDKEQILKALKKKNLKLMGEVNYNGRTAYKIQGKIIDFQMIDIGPGQGSQPASIEAKLDLLIDKETSIPLKTEYFRGNDKKPYRQMVYTLFKLNEPLDNKLFDIPSAQKEFPGWRPVKDIETARTLIKEKIDLPSYLPSGAKLSRIGFVGRNIRVEYLAGKNVIYITYGLFTGPEGEKRKIGDMWFDNVAENFWASSLSIQKGDSIVSVEGTLPLPELSRVAESVLTPEEKRQLVEREKLKEELIKRYKILPSDIKPTKTKFTGRIESLKISSVHLGESASGEEKFKYTTLYKAPFYVFTESNWSGTSTISIINNNRYLSVPADNANGYKLSNEPKTSINPIYWVEEEKVKAGVDKFTKRKVVGSAKYLKRPVTVVEYTYNYQNLSIQGIVDFKGPRSSKSILYVDNETGIILKQFETINGKEKVSYYVTEILVNPEINQRLFEISANLKPEIKNDVPDGFENYLEVSLEELKKKATVPVKIPGYLPEGTKLISASIFNNGEGPGKYDALQLYSVKDQPLIIYSRRKGRGEDLERQYPQRIEISGANYYYNKRGNNIIIESTTENWATHIESTIPLEELKKIIESLQN